MHKLIQTIGALHELHVDLGSDISTNVKDTQPQFPQSDIGW